MGTSPIAARRGSEVRSRVARDDGDRSDQEHATVACLPFAPLLVRDVEDAGATAIGWTVYLGIVPTAIGFATWAFALPRTSAGRMGAMIYLVPPIAVFLGWAILGEKPPWLVVAGGALCLGGVYLSRRE